MGFRLAQTAGLQRNMPHSAGAAAVAMREDFWVPGHSFMLRGGGCEPSLVEKKTRALHSNTNSGNAILGYYTAHPTELGLWWAA